CKKRERLDAVLVRAECARGNRILVKGGVARPRIVEAVEAEPFDRCDRQQIQQQRRKDAPFGGRHVSSRTDWNVSIALRVKAPSEGVKEIVLSRWRNRSGGSSLTG